MCKGPETRDNTSLPGNCPELRRGGGAVPGQHRKGLSCFHLNLFPASGPHFAVAFIGNSFPDSCSSCLPRDVVQAPEPWLATLQALSPSVSPLPPSPAQGLHPLRGLSPYALSHRPTFRSGVSTRHRRTRQRGLEPPFLPRQ